jgi:hypothetical protein
MDHLYQMCPRRRRQAERRVQSETTTWADITARGTRSEEKEPTAASIEYEKGEEADSKMDTQTDTTSDPIVNPSAATNDESSNGCSEKDRRNQKDLQTDEQHPSVQQKEGERAECTPVSEVRRDCCPQGESFEYLKEKTGSAITRSGRAEETEVMGTGHVMTSWADDTEVTNDNEDLSSEGIPSNPKKKKKLKIELDGHTECERGRSKTRNASKRVECKMR